MKYGYIKVTPEDELTVHYTSSVLDNDDLWDKIGGYYEIVCPALLQNTMWKDVRILCDDCGLLKENQRINKLASGLYAAPSPIVGNVLFVRQGFTEDGEADIFPFSGDDIQNLQNYLERLLKRLKTVKI